MQETEKINTIFPDEALLDHIEKPDLLEQRDFLSGGVIHPWKGPQTDVYSPVYVNRNGIMQQLRLGSYPEMGSAEALAVLEDARKAYNMGRGTWPTAGLNQRVKAVENFLNELIAKRQVIISLLMWEIGKNQAESAAEFDRTVEYLQDTIDAANGINQAATHDYHSHGILARINRSPLGVVLCMGPYNYPLNETFATLMPALIMGNVVIFRPAKYGILLIRPLLEAFRDVFPPGVINVIYGDGENTAGTLMSSGKIDVLAFIGSSRVANILKQRHPYPNRLRSVLGLDAKNPAILLPGADLDVSVNECVNGALAFNGQRCTALKLIFVHRSIAGEFLRRFCRKVASLKTGMPWEKDVFITPLPEPEKPAFLQELIGDALAKGAAVVNEGGGKQEQSLVFPTVLYPVDASMRIFHEEQFGPVIPVAVFDHIDEPVRYIMESNYGQQVSLFSNNADEIASLIDPLVNQVCRININAKCQRGPDIFPFSGRKDSAESTLSVHDALKVFSIRTLVATKGNAINQAIFDEIAESGQSNFLSSKPY